jgi:Eco57I restriction-modification methylase/restriction-modification enzyme MmeI-like protein
MKDSISQQGEWLSLIEVSGPFLAEPVLNQAFPAGLQKLDTLKKKQFRQTYDEWREAVDSEDELQNELHQQWIDWVLKYGLEWDEDDEGEELKTGECIPENIVLDLPEHQLKLKPNYVLFGSDSGKPYLLVSCYPANTNLNDVLPGDGWSTSPAERMSHLCRAAETRLGLVTNGEQWMLVDAPEDGITSYASWYARLWSQEPITLIAFFELLNIRTVFNGFGLNALKLTELLDESIKHQDEVTETLGAQVQRAVEVLVQSLDRINKDSNGELLEGIEPPELYEAGLTFMMRLVFLLCAEERGLLLLDDETYTGNYALSSLRMKLREEASLHGEEVLSYRTNAWSRLLALFRAVYGGIEHESMRMPALGGSLFDPDRFPFLEGRVKDSNWKSEEAKPLPIDNRTVLLFLDAIQLYQGRTLSYRALDVEQIGYVYEGLLERTVIRAPDVTLELDATQKSKKPWVLLGELASSELDGESAVKKLLVERTGSSASRVKNDLGKEVAEADSDALLLACLNDNALRNRIKPYIHFLKKDAWGNPMIYPAGAFIVATGADRRETGTHYTPKTLTEAIVLETLEPIVYIGPSAGTERGDWQLKSPAELLALKICDPAMGSGAFLVQVCRYLSERLCEAWMLAEESNLSVTFEGRVVDNLGGQEPITADSEERLVIARRLVAENCLYGVDVNPLAVELAKLSIWLVTFSKGRPFGFLDHNLRAGDSLLGITSTDQLHFLDMNPGQGSERKLFAQEIDQAVSQAIDLRIKLRERPIRDIRDVELMSDLDRQSRQILDLPILVGDALVGQSLKGAGDNVDAAALSVEVGQAFDGEENGYHALKQRANRTLSTDLPADARLRKPFHWCIEFPEVFSAGHEGFDAIVGNPPFLGGQKITGAMGVGFRDYLVNFIAAGKRGSADLVAYFFLRANSLISDEGYFGLIAVNTISEGNTREIGLDSVISDGSQIYRCNPNTAWPGAANVVTSSVHVTKASWRGNKYIGSKKVGVISSALTHRDNWQPVKLKANEGLVYQGAIILGDGFILDADTYAEWIKTNDKSCEVVFDYLIGKEANQSPAHTPGRRVINFFDWSEGKAAKFQKAFNYIVENVKPERIEGKDKGAREKWWRYLRPRPELFHTIGRGEDFSNHPDNWDVDQNPLEKVIVFATGATKYPCFTLVPNTYVYANTLCVVASQSFALFACLSSDLHAVWAWDHGSRMKQDLRYTHGDVFETFPFPEGAMDDSNSPLRDIGKKFFGLRAEYMQNEDKGMTKTYNDIHNPKVDSDAINVLRDIQMAINLAVASAYGFNDIDLEQGFHEVAYLPESKNLRFTISESAREEILYRLAMLNKERYELENGSTGTPELNARYKVYEFKRSQSEGLDKVAEPKPQTDLFSEEE